MVAYELATDSSETVINKNYPKKFRLELLPTGSLVLNQAYISTFLLGGQLSFYAAEAFGIHIEGAIGINSDLPSRGCLETFYNDVGDELGGVQCGAQYLTTKDIYETESPLAKQEMGKFLQGKNGVGFGPAYVPVREIDTIVALTFSWNFVYGKQLAFMTFTNYFDLYLKFGGGVAMSTYYPAQIYIKGTETSTPKKYRTDAVMKQSEVKGCADTYGICVDGENVNPNWANLIGTVGRPEPELETSPMITFAIGYRFHFWSRLQLMTEARAYLLLATNKNRGVTKSIEEDSKYLQNVENYLTISGGLGFRI